MTLTSVAKYERAGLGGRLSPGVRPAVVVVDLIRAFTDPQHPLGSDMDDEIAATRRLLDVARAGHVPVALTTIAYAPGLTDAGLWVHKVPALQTLELGSDWVEVDSRLGARPEEPVIVKKGASALFGTNLAALLASWRVDTVLLCGATTSGCVRATAVDLLQSSYPALVVRQCVGDRVTAQHQASLIDMEAKYADVIELDEALELIAAASAQRPEEKW